MKYVISRYNHDIEPIMKYAKDYVLYDRSEQAIEGAIIMPNIGSDIYDKFTYIIDNYDNLPDVVCLVKCNLFKYITEEEFIKVKDNKTFTPLLTQNHITQPGVSYYKDGIYHETNNYWYLDPHPARKADELMELLGLKDLDFIPFSPGSNYILPKENILKHSKEHYQLLRSFLEHDVYPGEAQIMERGLYTLWL